MRTASHQGPRNTSTYPRTQPPMRRGSREELAAELDKLATGWTRQGHTRTAHVAASAARRIRQGEVLVRVGGTLYRVEVYP